MTNAPKPPKIPKTTLRHGIPLVDDYAWMRQDNWTEMFQDTSLLLPEIRQALEAENTYARRNLIEPNKAFIDKLVAEMKSVIEIDYDSAGVQDGPWRYFARHSMADYPIFLRRDIQGKEEIIFDPNTEFGDRKVFLGEVKHSPDHKYLAIAVDFTGSEDTDIHIKDLGTGKIVAKLEHGDFPVWSPDSKSIYYAKMKEGGAVKRDRVFCHTIGTTPESDALTYGISNDGLYLKLKQTQSGRFLIIHLHDNSAFENHVLDLENPDLPITCLAPHADGIRYNIDHHGDDFYIYTNADGATDFKIMKTPIAAPQRQNWTEWEAHKPGRYIQRIICFENHMARLERENAMLRALITDMHTGTTSQIDFDEAAYDLDIDAAAEFHSSLLRVIISSPRRPIQAIDYDMNDRTRKILRAEKIADHDPEDYIVERLYVPSHDGVKVPVTITRHKDTKLDGTNPCHIYGYGAYGMSMPSGFGWFKKRFPLLKRGFICVTAHIRGGADCGFGWYEDGKMMKKKNSFLDFIACAQYLADNNYTSRGKIAIEGASAGGLLVGAVMNMAPHDLLGAVVGTVPFVDVVTTMCDTSLPLTQPEWVEWGNPVEDKNAFDYMLSYSPYDNLIARDYPPILISGGLTDPRVTYWEPAKFVAKLRDIKTDNNPLYQYIEMDSGHFGDPGRFGHLTEIARDLCFIIKSVGNFCAADISDEEWRNPDNKGCCA